jgi:hypothetical protein
MIFDELHQLHRMTVAEIAMELSRSKAWVSMRLGLIGEMSEKVRQEIFSGRFPGHPCMYAVSCTQPSFLIVSSSGLDGTPMSPWQSPLLPS